MQSYQNVAQDPFGNAIPNVTVTVKLAGTATIASIFSDNGVTPLSNPFTNTADGSFRFYAASGRYDVTLAKTGFTFVAVDLSDIVLNDAADNVGIVTPLPILKGGTGVATIAAHGIMIGEGTGPVVPIVLANGQLPIGSSGADPVAATLTAGTGISITPGAGVITIAATGGIPPLLSEFISADQTVTFGSATNVAHGFGVKPKLVMVSLKNITTEQSYSVDDEIELTSYASTGSGVTVVVDTTNVTVVFHSGGLSVVNKSAFTIVGLTAANWKFIVRAWK